MKHAFYVDRLLSHYFAPEEILHFRELQYRTGALISGSTAVQFFDRDKYPDSDLDVYVEHRFVRALTDWLVEIGYQYTPLSGSANMATLDAAFAVNPPELEHTSHYLEKRIIFSGQDYARSALVFNFEKRRPQRTIQLITSLMCPLRCILDFHSSMSGVLPYPIQMISLIPCSSSVCNEHHRTRQGLFVLPPSDVRTATVPTLLQGRQRCEPRSRRAEIQPPRLVRSKRDPPPAPIWDRIPPRHAVRRRPRVLDGQRAPNARTPTRVRGGQLVEYGRAAPHRPRDANQDQGCAGAEVRIYAVARGGQGRECAYLGPGVVLEQCVGQDEVCLPSAAVVWRCAYRKCSDMDADFLCALKKHRADIDEGEGAETSGSSPQSE